MPSLSIIVPLYNAENTLQSLIDSIPTQKEVEILLIDDASTDKSGMLCRCLAEQNASIRCFFQSENHGVSAARNIGLAAAQGEWLLFADADDRFMPGAVEQILRYAKHMTADLLCFNCMTENRTLCPARPIRPQQFGVARRNAARLCEDLYDLKSDHFCGEMFRAVWGKLFRKTALLQSQARFDEKMPLGEDCVFLMHFLETAPRVEFADACWYVYRTVGPSAVRRCKVNLLTLQMHEYRALLLEKARLHGADWDTMVYAFLLQCANSFAANERRGGADARTIFRRTLNYLQARPMELPGSFDPARLTRTARIRARFLQFDLLPAEAAAATLTALKRCVKPHFQCKKP